MAASVCRLRPHWLRLAGLSLVGCVLLLALGAWEAQAQEPSCTTSQCHSSMGKEANVHFPVQAGMCTACHQPVDEKTMFDGPRHRFTMAAEGAELCYTCHEPNNTKEVVHFPVQMGMCTACHDPHQSANPRQLKASPASELCYQCHERNKDTEAHVHGPVAIGLCASCHNPHESPNPRMLRATGPDLCVGCHAQKKEALEAGGVVHPPATMDCTFCHDPHTSPNPYQLKTQPPELCLTCHGSIKELLDGAAVVHGAVQKDKTCVNCHDPHATAQEKLLKRAGLDVCLFCHNTTLKDHQGKKLLNIKAWLENNPNHHGPILAGSCVFCHNPHGSPNFRLLVEAFPPTMYAPFKKESYALCLSCHDPGLSEPRTTSATGFRNGEKSLHFVHVNKNPKGRTCRFCHDVHASTKPHLLRETVAFGQFPLPLNYTTLPNGGKCMPGCHVPQGYDRVRAIDNPIDYTTFEGSETKASSEQRPSASSTPPEASAPKRKSP